MIVTRIIDGKPTNQTFTLVWLEENKDKSIKGVLVSDWVTAPVYEGDFISPVWNGSEYIEGASQEEINEIELRAKKEKRNELLEKGIVIEIDNVKYWFSKLTLNDFITAAQISEKAGATEIEWKADNGEWKVITLQQAFQIGAQGMQMIQQIYKDNA